jgi:hypothetical protein
MADESPLELLESGKLPSMVSWFTPKLLAQIAVRSIISSTIGQYADHRVIQAVQDNVSPDMLRWRHDYSIPSDDPRRTVAQDASGAVWIDYIADTGDGFESTYTMAYLLGRPALDLPGVGALPQGQIVVFGGDQTYPDASRHNYRERFQQPYEWAAPTCSPRRKLFALPGNHDWYDGLSAFDSLFCAPRDRPFDPVGTCIGGWQCQQYRSYWAIKLPHDWWIWGPDIQFSSHLDDSQISYFNLIADQMGPDHKVILCLSEPSWLIQQSTYDENENLNAISMIARKHGAKICAVIAGDSHHYARYVAQDIGTNFITSGGGGAFLHATHDLRTELEIEWPLHKQTRALGLSAAVEAVQRGGMRGAGSDWEPTPVKLSLKQLPARRKKKIDITPGKDLGEAAEEIAQDAAHEIKTLIKQVTGRPRCYPSRLRSAWLSCRNIFFSVFNWWFAMAIGLIYWVVTWSFHIIVTDSRIGGTAFNDIGRDQGWAGFKTHLLTLPAYIVEAMSYSIGFALMLATLLFSLIAYVNVDKTRPRLQRYAIRTVVGFLHFLAHLTMMMLLFVVLIRWHQTLAPIIQDVVQDIREMVRFAAPTVSQGAQEALAPIERGRGWAPHVLGFLYPLEMGLIGGFLGGSILGLYWVTTSIIAGMHCADSFAALRITGYKNFLRIKFEPDRLTIYPIGLDAVPGRRGWREPRPEELSDSTTPRLVPKRPLEPHLVERPVVIRARDIR